MATEGKRVVKLKRIVDPDDPDPQNPTSYVDMPTITEITFDDPGGSGGVSGGKFVRTFDSTQNNQARTTHTHTVKNQFGTPSNFQTDDTNRVDVERIDKLVAKNADQKEFVGLNNNDPPPLGPADDQALGHLKTHVVRYNKDNMNDPAATPWVDVELIDQIKLKGILKQRSILESRKSDAGQVFTYALQNDPGDDSFSDPDDPYSPTFSDITFWGTDLEMLPLDTNGNPDPVRLDPFQNLVNVKWSSNIDYGIICLRDGTMASGNFGDGHVANGNVKVLYLCQQKKAGLKVIDLGVIINGFIDFGTAGAGNQNILFGLCSAVTPTTDEWQKQTIHYRYVNGQDPGGITTIDETHAPPPPPDVKLPPKLKKPTFGLVVGGDANGTIYANTSDVTKLDNNGNVLWTITGANPQWITSDAKKGTLTVFAVGGHIVTYDAANGAGVGNIDLPSSDPQMVPYLDFQADTYGNFYACSQVSVSKFDKSGNLVWNKPNDNLLFGHLAVINKNVATIMATGDVGNFGYNPLVIGESDFTLIVYDDKGNVVQQQQIGLFVSAFSSPPPVRTYTEGQIDFIVGRQRFPPPPPSL